MTQNTGQGYSDITPEYLLQFREYNLDVPIELETYIDSRKKIRDLSAFWKRDFRPKNSWFRTRGTLTENEKLVTEINDLLNKLNKSNFDTIYESIIKLQLLCRDNMIKLVDRVIDGAITNNLYIDIYVKLCYKLMTFYITDLGEKIHFRDVLLTKIQETFAKYTTNDTTIEKNDLLGICKFIGNLYNNNVILNCVIEMCFITLYPNAVNKVANSIEAICTLMSIVGHMFFKKDPIKASMFFSRIEKLLTNGNISAKEKFTIQDLKTLKDTELWNTVNATL